MYCSKCSNEIKPAHKFCNACGNLVSALDGEWSGKPECDEFVRLILSNNLLRAVLALPDSLQDDFQVEFDRRRRKLWVAYLCHFALGRFGAAKFYLRETGWGILYASSTILAGILVICGFFNGEMLAALNFGAVAAADASAGLTTAACCLVFLFARLCFDTFLIPTQVNKANDRIRQEVLLKMAQELFPKQVIQSLPPVTAPIRTVAVGLAAIFVVSGVWFAACLI